MSVSRLDKVFRKILLTTFFNKGWGNPDHILRLIEFRKNLSDKYKCADLVPKNYPITILNQQTWKDFQIIEGKFHTPLAAHLPEVVSSEVIEAYFQLIVPNGWKYKEYRPICIHLAGTGDHYFWRRRNVMVKPLLKAGIGALLLENPFYGLRKPKNQLRSSLHYVSDIFVMGGCLILECMVLLKWCEQLGLGPLGLSGLSMGGHMASLAASHWPKPLVLVPCLSWSTASLVFTEGVMSDAINWDLLQTQYFSDSKFYDTLSQLCTIVDDPLEFTLSRITGITNDLLKSEQTSTDALTPFDVINLLNSFSTSNCAAFTPESMRQTLNQRIINVLTKTPLIIFKTIEYSIMKKRDVESVIFMRGIMDEFTHLKNFPVPVDTSLVISIFANADAYVPRQGCSRLDELWPGSTVRYLDAGHVGAFLWHRKTFQKAIIEAFERAKSVCPRPSKFCL